jgi:ferritin
LKKQSEEETSHACKIAQYMIARGAIPKIDKIDVVPQSWKGALEVFEDAYKHERHVSKLFDLLINVAHEEKDNATQNFLWDFVHEQVEEEASVLAIVDKLRRTNPTGFLFVDSQLRKRT